MVADLGPVPTPQARILVALVIALQVAPAQQAVAVGAGELDGDGPHKQDGEQGPRGAARDQPLDHAHADDRTGARWFELDPAMPTAGTEPVVGLLPTGGRERADAGVTSAIIALWERELRRAFRQASGAYGSSETLWSSRTVRTRLRLARILIAAGVASTATVRKALTSSSSRRPPHFARTWSKSIKGRPAGLAKGARPSAFSWSSSP